MCPRKTAVTQLTRLLPQEWRKGHHWSRAHKVSTCMYVCFCSTAPRWLCTTFLNWERLQAAWLPVVVHRGAVLAFCHCCHPTGRWLAALKVEKHGLIEERLTSAVFELVSKRTARPPTNAVRVWCFGGIVQLMCVWLSWTCASST